MSASISLNVCPFDVILVVGSQVIVKHKFHVIPCHSGKVSYRAAVVKLSD